MLKRICVYCGSSSGSRKEYADAAVKLGRFLVEHEIELVYGGAAIGIMGILADTVMKYNGKVIGIIPENLKGQVSHGKLTELHIVNNMHQRKKMMLDCSDAIIAMPGGFGTLEEIFEAVTWVQLRLHKKPCGFLDVAGYYDRLIDFLMHAVDEKFIRRDYLALLPISEDPEELLEKFRHFQPPVSDKWINMPQ